MSDRSRRWRQSCLVVGLVLLAVTLVHCGGAARPAPVPAVVVHSPGAMPSPVPATSTPSSRGTPTQEAAPGTALLALAALSVRGRAAKTGYDRDQFGTGWSDTDDNSCSTRQDILRRDLSPVTVLAGTQGCAVLSGTLDDPYTGTRIRFAEGATTSDDVQIDHVVSLSDAWQKGAQQWSSERRVEFANDPVELLATDGPTNAAKGDSDAASWLPPAKPSRCDFIVRQISVKAGYGLWVTAAERDAMRRVLSTCPGRALLTRSAASRPHAPTATVKQPPQAGEDPVSYPDCDAVRAAGAAPLHAGDPGYSRRLDGDGDGVGCE